jgi:uncharacterized protein with HEPN domain
MKRHYEDYLEDILDSIYAIEIFVNGIYQWNLGYRLWDPLI